MGHERKSAKTFDSYLVIHASVVYEISIFKNVILTDMRLLSSSSVNNNGQLPFVKILSTASKYDFSFRSVS